MNYVNQQIVDSIIKKAEKTCPNSLALIGIYGSVATGDDYPKSDLDLMILINDDNGWKLGYGFILDDIGVGYDIYCTSWNMIKRDAECNHSHLSKLFDSKIIYVKDEPALKKLEEIKAKAKDFLISYGRFEKAKNALKNAKLAYAEACLSNSISKVRTNAADGISYLLDAVMLFNGKYFKKGVKRTFEELELLNLPSSFTEDINAIAKSDNIDEIRMLLKSILLYVDKYITVTGEKEKPSADNIAGSYEEMYSNWRNKVEEAAFNGDTFSSYMNLCSLQNMIHDMAEDAAMEDFEIMDMYNPNDLSMNVKVYDEALEKYKKVYECAGIKPKHFLNVDEFAKDYLR